MKKLNYLLALFALLITLQLDAQDKRSFHDYLYGDIKVGVGTPLDEGVVTQTTISLGYRIDDHHAIGIGRHYENRIVNAMYGNWSYTSYAPEYRYSTANGLIAKVAGGWVHAATHEQWLMEEDAYQGEGYFYEVSLDYQFKFGATVGVSFSRAHDMNFDYWEYDAVGGAGTVPSTSSRTFTNLGVSLGYAFPRPERS